MVSFLCGSMDTDLMMSLESCTSSSVQSSLSGESSLSSSTSTSNTHRYRNAEKGLFSKTLMCVKPHKANDASWEAIRSVRRRDGGVGLKHFKLVRRLGSGDIGNVFLCELRGFGNRFYAMKVVNREALSYRNKLHRADMEKEILSLLDHPFLPTLYAHFDAAQYSCTVMEYCPGGDLHSLRHKQPAKRFTLRSARFYVAEVLLALEYLHMMGIIFRDLKPENVLVRADGHIMLTDFDLSLRCDVVPTVQNKTPLNADANDTHHRLSRVHTCSSASSSSSSSCCSNSNSTISSSSSRCCTCAIKPSRLSSGRRGCMPIVRWLLSSASIKKRLKANKLGYKTNDNKTSIVKVQPDLVAEPSEVRSRSFVGTHEYLAPEVTSGQGHGSAVDWWTFGVFLFELLYGRTPFKGSSNETTILNIISQPLKFPPDPTNDTQTWEAAKDLITRLLAKDPCARLGSNRGSADIKSHAFFRGINWALIRSAAPPEIPGLRRTHSCYEKKKQPNSIPSHFDYF